MKLTVRFVPFKDEEVQKTAPAYGKFVFEGTDFVSLARSIARKIQLYESKINDDPQSPDRNRVWYTIVKTEGTHIPAQFLESDLNDEMGTYMSRGEWDFYSPQ